MKNAIAGMWLLLVCGCASYNPKYESYCTYANTRKLVDVDQYPAYKIAWAPLMFIPETIASPVTCYIDAANNPPVSKDQHVYLTYVGFRTIRNAMALNDNKVRKPVMCVALGLIAVVDTVWFPVAGLIDTTWIVTRPNPEDRFNSTSPAEWLSLPPGAL